VFTMEPDPAHSQPLTACSNSHQCLCPPNRQHQQQLRLACHAVGDSPPTCCLSHTITWPTSHFAALPHHLYIFLLYSLVGSLEALLCLVLACGLPTSMATST
jgi:hypothetical protein